MSDNEGPGGHPPPPPPICPTCHLRHVGQCDAGGGEDGDETGG